MATHPCPVGHSWRAESWAAPPSRGLCPSPCLPLLPCCVSRAGGTSWTWPSCCCRSWASRWRRSRSTRRCPSTPPSSASCASCASPGVRSGVGEGGRGRGPGARASRQAGNRAKRSSHPTRTRPCVLAHVPSTTDHLSSPLHPASLSHRDPRGPVSGWDEGKQCGWGDGVPPGVAPAPAGTPGPQGRLKPAASGRPGASSSSPHLPVASSFPGWSGGAGGCREAPQNTGAL